MSTMSNLNIHHGPFAGQQFDPAETYFRANDDGTTYNVIVMASLTQRFLERFPPTEGWSVRVEGEILPMDMVPLERPETRGQAAGHVPAARFVATLSNPEGVIVGTASTLWTLTGPTDWERGETNARQRLYDAMGLQSRFGEAATPSEARRPAALAAVKTLPVADAKPVTVRAVVERSAAPEPVAAQAAEVPVQELVAEAEVQSASVATDAPSEQAQSQDTAPVQSGMDLGTEDPMQMPPPQAMVTQIERLARLMNRDIPEMKTREQAQAFLAQLQGRK